MAAAPRTLGVCFAPSASRLSRAMGRAKVTQGIKILHVGPSGEALSADDVGQPLLPKKEWGELPGWLIQPASRGKPRLCYMGHRLVRRRYCQSVHEGDCYECDEVPNEEGSGILFCPRCWQTDNCCFYICAGCNRRPRLPSFEWDALFHGPHTPAVLVPPPGMTPPGLGTVIVRRARAVMRHPPAGDTAWIPRCGRWYPAATTSSCRRTRRCRSWTGSRPPA